MEAERTGRRTRRRPWAVALEPEPLGSRPDAVSCVLSSLRCRLVRRDGEGLCCACGGLDWCGSARLGSECLSSLVLHWRGGDDGRFHGIGGRQKYVL
jgi:hypothetical protein